MADFHIISAAFILLFTLLTTGTFSTQTREKIYEKTTIPARVLDGLQIFKTIHNVTKIHCGVICSQYEDRCNAIQLLDIKSRKGTCQLFRVNVHCVTFDSTPNVTIYTSTDHSATYRPENQLDTSCAAIHSHDWNMASGVYTIHPAGNNSARAVYCDMCTDGGGWTVIQRRHNGSVQFNRTWEEYKQGFGSAYGEHWIGNVALHQLTANQPCELRVDLGDWQDQHGYAVYTTFHVASEADNFRLTVTGYSGTAGNSMGYTNNLPFSTTDRDHTTYDYNCNAGRGGGVWWWYGRCSPSNLNDRYIPGGVMTDWNGVLWYHWRGLYSCKTTSMMTRPKQ